MGSEDEFSKKLQGLKSFIGDIEQDYKNSIKGYKESIEGYESRINELENICGQQNKVMTELHIKLREKDKWFLKSTEQGYKQRAKTSEMSYLVIGGSGKIIASTDAFKEQFHFTEYKLIGESYFSVLKIPEDSPDYIHNFKDFFKNNPEQIKVETTIYNGKGAEKIVVLEKERPVSTGNYFYTKVHIHEIGSVKRTLGKVMRKLHLSNKVPKTVPEMISNQEVQRVVKETDEKKDEILKRDSEETPKQSK
tara:strand:+ start:963 stop:1712 length:750 start_codon:yes stop_codon:yes gene_type:complete